MLWALFEPSGRLESGPCSVTKWQYALEIAAQQPVVQRARSGSKVGVAQFRMSRKIIQKIFEKALVRKYQLKHKVRVI